LAIFRVRDEWDGGGESDRKGVQRFTREHEELKVSNFGRGEKNLRTPGDKEEVSANWIMQNQEKKLRLGLPGGTPSPIS